MSKERNHSLPGKTLQTYIIAIMQTLSIPLELNDLKEKECLLH